MSQNILIYITQKDTHDYNYGVKIILITKGKIMNKIILTIALITISAFGQNALAANFYPTNGIAQEMAGTVNKGAVSIDLVNHTGYRSSVRVGMFGGEIIYTPDAAGAIAPLIGYKHAFTKNMAAYGLFNFDSETSTPDTLLGFSYSGGSSSFMYNANVEVLSPGAGGPNTVEFKAGGYYAITTQSTGRMYLIGELALNTEADTTNMYAAMRFAPKKNVNIDVGLFHSFSGGGFSTSSFGAPLFFRLTLDL